PLGNEADMPPPRQFEDSDRWHIGKPDVVVKLKKDVLVKAKAPDYWADLPMEDLGLKTDRYIQAIEVKPLMGANVVHHAVSNSRWEDEQGNEQQGLLEEYAVGKFGEVFLQMYDQTRILGRASEPTAENAFQSSAKLSMDSPWWMSLPVYSSM